MYNMKNKTKEKPAPHGTTYLPLSRCVWFDKEINGHVKLGQCALTVCLFPYLKCSQCYYNM